MSNNIPSSSIVGSDFGALAGFLDNIAIVGAPPFMVIQVQSTQFPIRPLSLYASVRKSATGASSGNTDSARVYLFEGDFPTGLDLVNFQVRVPDWNKLPATNRLLFASDVGIGCPIFIPSLPIQASQAKIVTCVLTPISLQLDTSPIGTDATLCLYGIRDVQGELLNAKFDGYKGAPNL